MAETRTAAAPFANLANVTSKPQKIRFFSKKVKKLPRANSCFRIVTFGMIFSSGIMDSQSNILFITKLWLCWNNLQRSMMQNMKEQPVPYSVSERVACSMKPPNPVQILKYGFGSMQHVVHYESTFIGYKLLSRSWSASWACENPLLTQV